MLTAQRIGKTQDFIEETAEFQVGIDDASRRRRMRMGSQDRTIVAGEVEDVPVREAILCYCQCMQITLQASLLGLSSTQH